MISRLSIFTNKFLIALRLSRIGTFRVLLSLGILLFQGTVSAAGLCKEIYDVESALIKLSDQSMSGLRRNPTEIDLANLKVGDYFYLDSELIEQKLPGLDYTAEPIKWHYVKRLKGIAYLQSEKFGSIELEAYELFGKIYSAPDYQLRSRYEVGEWVQIGKQGDMENTFLLFPPDQSGRNSVDLKDSYAVHLGKVIQLYDKDNYIVEIQIKSKQFSQQIIVPRKKIVGLTSGTVNRFKNAIDFLLSMPPLFKPNEEVRYRDSQGLIKTGRFVRTNAKYSTLLNKAGERIYIPNQSIYPMVNPKPKTIFFNYNDSSYNGAWLDFENPSNLVRKFLDAAGKLSGLKNFATQSPESKILVFMRYLHSHIKWTTGALNAEDAGFNDFNEVICSGAGVCRHLAPLLGTTLSEAGFKVRLAIFRNEIEGHAWLEVDVLDENGVAKTYVVDPSAHFYIKSLDEVNVEAAQNNNSFAAKYYTQPQRQLIHRTL